MPLGYNPLSKKAIEDRFGISLPAGLGNLSFPVREQIKADHKRRIERIRAKLIADEQITEADLER